MSVLAIIPARCGSKGIPNKNIIDVNGRPLVDYSISLARRLKEDGFIGEFVVSTDCERIAEVVAACHAKPPFLRPERIAGDTAKSKDFVLHALDWFKVERNLNFEHVLILQPTSPLRNYEKVSRAIQFYLKSEAESLISVHREDYINPLVLYRKHDLLTLVPLDERHNKGVRRQEHGATYVRNGSIYLVKSQYVRETGCLIGDQPTFVEMTKIESINIDTEEDLEMIRCLIDTK